jgi:hypothetical protein
LPDLNMEPIHNQEGMDDMADLFLPDLNILAQDGELNFDLEGNQDLNGNEGNAQLEPISLVLNSFEQSISDAGEEIEQQPSHDEDAELVLALPIQPVNFLHLELQPEDLDAIEDFASEPAIDLVNGLIPEEEHNLDLGA